MNVSVYSKLSLFVLACFTLFVLSTSFVFADHGDAEESVSHAETVHEDTGSEEVAESTDPKIEKMQQLIAVLKQLIELLEHQAEHNAEAHDAEEAGVEEDHNEGEEHHE